MKQTSIPGAGSFLKAEGGRRMVFGLNCCGWSLPLQGFFFREAERRGVINEPPLRLGRREDWSGCADVGVSPPTARAIGALLTATHSFLQNILHPDTGIMIRPCSRLAPCTFSRALSLSPERLFISSTDEHCIRGCNFPRKCGRKMILIHPEIRE